ncbi:hypothetical protein QA597_01445 [Marinilabiliaceae bacterium ANBcel2]|nr:hypothetical protein [Marinilabiliaceae bacterium ANBcel2]
MRQLYLLTVLFLFCFISLDSIRAQSRDINQARSFLGNGLYREAFERVEPYIGAVDEYPKAVLIAGIALLNIDGKEDLALELLKKAAESFEWEESPSREAYEARFYLGQALHLHYEFERAMKLFSFLKENSENIPQYSIEAIERELNYCYNAIKLIENPVDFDIAPLGDAVNSSYNEHSPVVSLDESTIYFTSDRPVEEVGDEEHYFENIYVSHWREGRWSDAELLDIPGIYFGNRSTVSISADGRRLVLYQDDGGVGNLYETTRRFGEWLKPEPFPAPVNSSYNETHGVYSFDGDAFYFVSDRPGGYGGTDIYVSYKLPDGRWGYPVNLGPQINTRFNEDSPYLSPDGETLYFSSQGHNSMGGFDIFYSEMQDDGEWGEAQNIGYPVNTPDDDIFYMPTPDDQRVYFASRRIDDTEGINIYLITYPESDRRRVSIVASHVYNQYNEPVDAALVRIYDSENNFLKGVFRPDAITGKFVAVLPSGKDYYLEIEAEHYDLYETEFTVPVRDVYGSRGRAYYIDQIKLNKIENKE